MKESASIALDYMKANKEKYGLENIAFDKEDIVTVAKQIGTYETSILPYEDCCTTFVAKHPVTKPKVEQIRRSEKALAEKIDEMVAEALAGDEVLEIR